MSEPIRAYQGHQPYVFVCYAHADKAIAYREIEWLHAHGINVWYDEGVSPGEEWTEELGHAIERAERFIYLVTPASVASRNCRNEVHFAQKHGKPMLIVHLRETVLPPGLELAIGSTQAILSYQLSDDVYRQKLVAALGRPATISITASRVRRRRRALVGVLLVTIAAIATAVWFWRQPPNNGSAEKLDRGVAVRPIGDAELNPDEAAYVRGLVDEVRGVLATDRELRVASRGDAPDVAYAVQLIANHEGGQLRVRAELTRTADGKVVASQATDFPNDAVKAGPSTAAPGIARAIRFQLKQDELCESVRRKARVPEAAELLCAAIVEQYAIQQGSGSRDNSLMLSNAQRAVELDPELPEAYYYLSLALGERGTWSRNPQEDFEASKAAVLAGLALAPNDPNLLYRKGVGELFYDWNLRAARESLQRAIALNPNHGAIYHALGLLALREGDVREALEHCRRAIRIFDTSANTYAQFAGVLFMAEEFDEAVRAADTSLSLLAPGSPQRWGALFWKARSQRELGDLTASRATLDELLRLVRQPNGFIVLLLAQHGRVDQARRMLAELERQPNPRAEDMASAYLPFDIDRTFEWLNVGVDSHQLPNTVLYLRTAHVWDPLRQDPRWDALMQKLARIESGV